MLDTLTLATFTPHIGATFRVHLAPDRTIETELVEAQSLISTAPGAAPASSVPASSAAAASGTAATSSATGPTGRPAPREPFSIVLKGPAQPILQQRTYRIEHETVGAHELFIVPIGPGGGGMLYQAIFT